MSCCPTCGKLDEIIDTSLRPLCLVELIVQFSTLDLIVKYNGNSKMVFNSMETNCVYAHLIARSLSRRHNIESRINHELGQIDNYKMV